MSEENKAILKEYLNNAREKISSARILLEHQKYDDSVSRSYYAVFHCVQALLLNAGFKAESHSGARQLFGLHFVKTGKFDKKYARYLKNLKDDRENGDYGIFSLIGEEEARDSLEEAEEFYSKASSFLAKE